MGTGNMNVNTGGGAANVFPPTKTEAQCASSAAVTVTPTPTPSNTASNTGLSNEMQDVLNLHNMYRCMHGVPEMTWDADVAASAQATVDEDSSSFVWPNRVNGVLVGELRATGVPSLSGRVATELWYGAIKFTSPTGSPSS